MINMSTEIWKDIPDYENLYQSSNYGDIRRKFDRYGNLINKILKYHIDNGGYYRVCLCKNSKTKWYRIHRLVMISFKYIKDYKQFDVRHIDGNPKNNNINNLAWCTHKENTADKKVHNTIPDFNGSKNPSAILEDKDIIKIREYADNGMKKSLIAKLFNISYYTIWDIVNRRSWKNI